LPFARRVKLNGPPTVRKNHTGRPASSTATNPRKPLLARSSSMK
jgi:hypothetical protein